MAKKKRERWCLEKVDLGTKIEYHVTDGDESASTFEGCCDLLNQREQMISNLKAEAAVHARNHAMLVQRLKELVEYNS